MLERPASQPSIRFAIGIGVFVAGIICTGCSDSTDDMTSAGLATYETHGDMGGNASQLSGVLDFSHGCLYLDESERWILIFPADQVDVGETAESFAWHIETYQDGDEIAVGGSHVVDSEDISNLAIPDACDENTPLWLVHPQPTS